MGWIRVALVVVLALYASGCANQRQEDPEFASRETAPSTTIAATPTTRPLSTESTVPTVEEPTDHLLPIFSFLGERVWDLEAVGFDAETDQYVVYTKRGEGGPSVEYRDTLPPIRPPFELSDDGGGRTPGEGHMIIRNPYESFEAYWTEGGEISLHSLRTDADPLHGRGSQHLVTAPGGRILFTDVRDDSDGDQTSTLRSNRVGTDGQYMEEWSVEFESEIVLVLDVHGAGVLVATGARVSDKVEAIDRVHLVETSGLVRSIAVAPGLLALQLPVADAERDFADVFRTCGDEQNAFEANGLQQVDSWHVDTTNQLLTACAGGVPISTTTWCCGMGEFVGSMDSNRDGVEEVFVGGTSVGGGGGGLYSLVEGTLAPIRTDDGEDLEVLSGDTGGGYFTPGCRDDHFVQVDVRVDGEMAWADRVFYRIDGHTAAVANKERVTWRVEAGTSVWQAHDSAPSEIVSDLYPCKPPDTHDLAGTDGLRIHVRPHALSNAATCEVRWPRPYSPLMLTYPDGTRREWGLLNGIDISVHRIAPDDFLSTTDGRFALLDLFACSHEGTIKTIYTGRYDPMSGHLIGWQRVEPPAEFVNDDVHQRHPDRLVISDDGRIVGELDTPSGTLELPLG